jgi:4-hydroxy-tetrahydrodipicolinate synthase
MELKKLRGCGTALVTPFQAGGALDEAALRGLARRQIEQGIDFLIPCGTTGESPVLTAEEHARVVGITLEEARGKVPVIAGAGGNNTRHVCEQVSEMERLGVDGILSVSPYYNKPTQEGIFQHYRAVARATTLPVILYNVPGRTGSNIEPSTIVRLAEIPNILGVKEASGNIAQITEILRRVPERFRVISGDDAMTLPMMAMGACGVISVASNVAPREMTELVSLANEADFRAARRLHFRLLPLMQTLFIESSPIPVKAALAAMGLIQPIYRLPLVPMQPETHAKLMKVLEDLDLLPVPSEGAAKEKQYAAGGAD